MPAVASYGRMSFVRTRRQVGLHGGGCDCRCSERPRGVPADKVAYIEASITITDTTPAKITGQGPLYRTTLLGNLGWVWDSGHKFTVQRGTGPIFLIGLDVEPLFTIGPLAFQPPAFTSPFLQRHGFLFRKRYMGVFGLYLQPRFSAVLTEDQINPKLTGTLESPGADFPGDPPGTIEVVLESIATADGFL
jgi:hypothetical protein